MATAARRQLQDEVSGKDVRYDKTLRKTFLEKGIKMGNMTIKDIAKKCGVGVSTVSRAMNNHPDINPEDKRADFENHCRIELCAQ